MIATPGSTAAALAAKATTTTIPIIFATGADPVAAGLVPTLNRPGRNVTGVATLNAEVGPKRLDLLRQVNPAASNVALLINPTNPAISEPLSRDVQAAARTLGVRLHVLHASSDGEIEAAFAALRGLQVGGLVIGSTNSSTAGADNSPHSRSGNRFRRSTNTGSSQPPAD